MFFFIPGELVALLTFPGVIMHEISHRLMCDFFKIPVYEIGYFNIGEKTAGHVRHGKSNNVRHDLWIGVAPLFINGILCMILTFPYASSVSITGAPSSISMILYWVGISMGMNSIPSNQDLSSITEKNAPSEFALFVCSTIRLFNKVDYFFLDLVYAVLLSSILPYLVFGKFL